MSKLEKDLLDKKIDKRFFEAISNILENVKDADVQKRARQLRNALFESALKDEAS